MKKIFHIITHFDVGGAERVAVSIAKSPSPGFEYHIVELVRARSEFTKVFIAELESAGIHYHRANVPNVRFHYVFERLAAMVFPLWFLPLFLRLRRPSSTATQRCPTWPCGGFSSCFPA